MIEKDGIISKGKNLDRNCIEERQHTVEWYGLYMFISPFFTNTHLIHFTLSYKLSALVSPSTIIAAQTHTKNCIYLMQLLF